MIFSKCDGSTQKGLPKNGKPEPKKDD